MTFRVGQKITMKWNGTFRSDGSDTFGDQIYPKFGVVYTVRGTVVAVNGPGVWLVEIINPPKVWDDVDGPLEQTFHVDAFRPVVERKTIISIFERMLTGGKPVSA